MIDVVLAFACIMTGFELAILSVIPPRIRLRILGNDAAKMSIHLIMILINLAVHWGTVTGTMAATLSFLTSMLATGVASRAFGKITQNRYYQVGWIKYSKEELK